jgi:monofunctional biosynthetic peptidoglycan transglycosylase
VKRSVWQSLLRWASYCVLFFYGFVILSLVLLKWVDPFTTAVQAERRVQSFFHKGDYRKQYHFVPLSRISLAFQHAVIAAEDARFYQHHGFDWKQVAIATSDDLGGKRLRGASSIDQQLAKNLFLTTSRSLIRKGIEATIVPLEEVILGKQRILELYLNVVEWGPGTFGAEAAARRFYRIPATRITREEGARLAAILPAPRRRKPAAMNDYSSRILARMRQMGW